MVRSPMRLGSVEMAVGLPERLKHPRLCPHQIFFAILPYGQLALFVISVVCLFFFCSPASLSRSFSCLFILLLLKRGNVHLNAGPIFPCSMCAGNVTWRRQVSAMLRLILMGTFRVHLPNNLAPSPAVTHGVAIPAAFQLLLRIPNPPTLRLFSWALHHKNFPCLT